MNKPLIVVFVLLAAGLVAFVYERRSIANQIQPVMQFWFNATQQAQSNSVTSKEFYALHSDKGTMIDDPMIDDPKFGQRLRQQVSIDSVLCSSIEVDVLYNVSNDDSANLVLISRQSEDWLC